MYSCNLTGTPLLTKEREVLVSNRRWRWRHLPPPSLVTFSLAIYLHSYGSYWNQPPNSQQPNWENKPTRLPPPATACHIHPFSLIEKAQSFVLLSTSSVDAKCPHSPWKTQVCRGHLKSPAPEDAMTAPPTACLSSLRFYHPPAPFAPMYHHTQSQSESFMSGEPSELWMASPHSQGSS